MRAAKVSDLAPRSARTRGGTETGSVHVTTHAKLQQALRGLFGEAGKLVQSMYFEGNPATWPHQDTYYLDAQQIGRMTAAWIAVEDIAPGAGRFFIYPKSHLLTLAKNSGEHDRYKKHVLEIIESNGFECRAPALEEGDVLLWAAKTIHGSLVRRFRPPAPSLRRRRCTATRHRASDCDYAARGPAW